MPIPSQREITEFKEQLKVAQEIMVEGLKSVAEDDELYKWAARAYRQLYLKLVDEGFSQDQALSIVQGYNPLQSK